MLNKNPYSILLTPINRTEIFQASQFVDNFIAEVQASYAQYIDVKVPSEKRMLEKYYDHLEPLAAIEQSITGHCVLAYPANDKKDYIAHLPIAMQRFYAALGITSLYLMDFNNTPLYQFPFENFKKHNKFKHLAKGKANGVGYQIAVQHLHQVLPLFFFSRKYDVPVIFLLTAIGTVPLSIRMCDDGNLHLNFQEMYRRQVEDAASAAELCIGDLEICTVHRLHELR